MVRFITVPYVVTFLLFLLTVFYLVLFITKHKVYQHLTLFIFTCIVSFFLLAWLLLTALRNENNIGRPLFPKFNFVPKSYTTLDKLPLNRYPFYGAHDAGTFVKINRNRNAIQVLSGIDTEWLYTQSLDFAQMYYHGVRFLDCRFQYFANDPAITFRHGSGEVFGTDIGGIFYPINDPNYASLDTFLSNAITDNDIVMFKVTKEKGQNGDRPLYNNENTALWTGNYFKTNPTAGTTSIMANLAYYLSSSHSGMNYLSRTLFINNVSELSKTVGACKQEQKNIIVVRGDFINDNWDANVLCQTKPFTSLDFSESCNNNTCINQDDPSWTTGSGTSVGLFSHMAQIGTAYASLSNTSQQINITQMMFQSYAGQPGLWLGLPLPFQDCINGEITNLDYYAHVTYRVSDYLRSNPTYLANAVFMDNIGVQMSPIYVDGIAISWSKMISYQLKENYLNAIAARNPFVTQYGL